MHAYVTLSDVYNVAVAGFDLDVSAAGSRLSVTSVTVLQSVLQFANVYR